MDNKAGKSTRLMAKKRRQTTNIILMLILLVGIILAFVVLKWQELGIGAGAVLVILIFLKILPDLIDKPINRRVKLEKRADRGAAAEEVVGEILDSLGDEYCVLNDINCPYGNIDHIVIGKNSGLFLLETKAHGGRVEILSDNILINGKPPEKDFIAQTLKNTYWLREEVQKITGRKIWVTPVLVFTNAFVPMGKPIMGITITNKKFLQRILTRQTKFTSDNEVLWASRESILSLVKN